MSVRWYYAGPLDPLQVPQLFSDPTSPTTTATFPFAGSYPLAIDVTGLAPHDRDFVDGDGRTPPTRRPW